MDGALCRASVDEEPRLLKAISMTGWRTLRLGPALRERVRRWLGAGDIGHHRGRKQKVDHPDHPIGQPIGIR